MKFLKSVLFAVLVALFFANQPAADPPRQGQALINEIIREVIVATTDRARITVRQNTNIDPIERGYIPQRQYEPVRGGVSGETRRELIQLNREHDSKIRKLEDELQRTLYKARTEFEREAAREDKSDKIREKRGKLRRKVDRAYDKFERKVDEENRRFDEKRTAILTKGGRR